MFKIIMLANIRAGNKIYAQKNKSYGICSLKKNHINIKKNHINFTFMGKSGVNHNIIINNNKLAVFLKKLLLSNNSNTIFDITTEELNNYLKNITEYPFTTKDFRTYSANYHFIDSIRKLEYNEKVREKNIRKIINDTAKKLGHTNYTSKKSYISKKIINTYPHFKGKTVNEIILNILRL